MANEKLILIRGWLTHISRLTRARDPVTPADIEALAEALDAAFPASLFNAASARHCALGSDFFPGLHSLTERLTKWQDMQRPAQTPIAQPGSPESELTGADLQWWGYWYERRPAAAVREAAIKADGTPVAEHSLPLHRLAALVRDMSAKAWRVISVSHAPTQEAVDPRLIASAVQDAVAATHPPQLARSHAMAPAMPVRLSKPVDDAEASRWRDGNALVQAARAQANR